MKRSSIKRRTPLRAAHEMQRRTGINPRRTQRDEIPPSVRKAVRVRSGGWCECGCGRPAEHVHHRKLRSQGGRHELVNLLHLSFYCHDEAHRNRSRAEALGLIVPAWADPADVPVIRLEGAA